MHLTVPWATVSPSIRLCMRPAKLLFVAVAVEIKPRVVQERVRNDNIIKPICTACCNTHSEASSPIWSCCLTQMVAQFSNGRHKIGTCHNQSRPCDRDLSCNQGICVRFPGQASLFHLYMRVSADQRSRPFLFAVAWPKDLGKDMDKSPVQT